jgi:hypothetical protein
MNDPGGVMGLFHSGIETAEKVSSRGVFGERRDSNTARGPETSLRHPCGLEQAKIGGFVSPVSMADEKMGFRVTRAGRGGTVQPKPDQMKRFAGHGMDYGGKAGVAQNHGAVANLVIVPKPGVEVANV